MPPAGGRQWHERWPLLLVVTVVLFNAIALTSELVFGVPVRNDSQFHLLMVRGASEALASGANPLDFWIPQLELGFPQFLYYQHLPHLLLAIVHRLSFGTVTVEALFHGLRYLLLVGMPLTVLWSMRRMGYSLLASALAGAASALFVADNRMGLEYNSYVTRGFGLFSQLVAVHLTFVTVGCLWVTLREGRGHVAAAAALAALVLSHLLFGVIIAIMALLMLLLGGPRVEWRARTWRLIIVGAVAAVLCSYMLVPFIASSKAWLSTMPWTISGSGRSAQQAGRVLAGALFDDGRLPVLSLLVLAGLIAASRAREPRSRFAAVGLVVFAFLYLARPDSEWLEWLLPAHTGWVSHRFVSAVGIFAILVIGVAGDAVAQFIARMPTLRTVAASASLTLVSIGLLMPAIAERWGYYRDQREVVEETRTGIATAKGLTEILAAADTIGGRIYAGPVTRRACAMHVGPALCVSDLLNARGRSTVGNPLQSLSLPAGLVHDIAASDPSAYDLFDVRAVIVESGRPVPAFFQLVKRQGDYALYQVQTSGMAQYVGVDARRSTARQDSLYVAHETWLKDGGARSRRTTRWDYRTRLQPHAPRPLCVTGGRTTREEITSQSVLVDVRCEGNRGDTLAVAIKMAFHPQWDVTVDGRSVTPYMVSPGYLAVDVGAGAHRIEARYRAHPAKIPLLVLGVLTLVAAYAARARLERFA